MKYNLNVHHSNYFDYLSANPVYTRTVADKSGMPLVIWLDNTHMQCQRPIIRTIDMDRLPITKEEIERLIIADLQGFPGCEQALAVVVAPLFANGAGATWTVSHFKAGRADGDACDRALQHIVAHFQRAYDLVSKH